MNGGIGSGEFPVGVTRRMSAGGERGVVWRRGWSRAWKRSVVHNVASQLPQGHVTHVTGLSNFHFWAKSLLCCFPSP